MAIISPFRALRPTTELADKVASRPYDVLNSAEAKEAVKGNKYSFLHVTKPEIDLPDNTDVYSAAVYGKAKENLQQFIYEGVLFAEEKPSYYIYRLIMPPVFMAEIQGARPVWSVYHWYRTILMM